MAKKLVEVNEQMFCAGNWSTSANFNLPSGFTDLYFNSIKQCLISNGEAQDYTEKKSKHANKII